MATLIKNKIIPIENLKLENCNTRWKKIRYAANVYFAIADDLFSKKPGYKVKLADFLTEDGIEKIYFSVDYIALAVNMSFAIELGIKSILSKQNISFKKIHELSSLYELLPKSMKDLFFEDIKIVKLAYDDFCEQSFLEKLKLFNNIYTQYRFFFEGNHKKNIKENIEDSYILIFLYHSVRNYINYNLH